MDGFTFEPDELEAVRAEWARLHDDLVEDEKIGRDLVGLLAQGLEPASENVRGAGSRTGADFHESNAAMRLYVEKYLENLTRARDEYLRNDADARRSFRPEEF